jgi:hypothetical protein
MKRIFWATVAYVVRLSLSGEFDFFEWLWGLVVYLIVFELAMWAWSDSD